MGLKETVMRGFLRFAAAAAIGLGVATTANAQTTHNVDLTGFVFVPADITIQVGDTVRWTWLDGLHNVESGIINAGVGVPDGNFRSGDPTGIMGTYEVMFDQAFLNANPMAGDIYPYYCIVHVAVDMAGTVTVEPVPVPTVSEWGLAAMTLLVLAAETITITRQRVSVAAAV